MSNRHTLPGQLDMPQTEERMGELAKAKAAAPMRPAKPQKPCDVGLFSDEADQMDLIEMFIEPVDDDANEYAEHLARSKSARWAAK